MATKVPHILVIGGGFGGIEVCKRLAKSDVRISLVDKHNYHLFQPLLYQVAGAALSPADIAYPIRTIFREQGNVSVYMGEALSVDLEHKAVSFKNITSTYDYLVLACGATHSYFGKDHWKEEAPGLKTIDDATEIRKRILLAFEEAEYEADEESRRGKLTFVIVGGGPTGVELAGTLKEIAVDTIPDDFRNVDTSMARIILVHAGPRILPTFHEKLSAAAQKDLERMGVEVLLNSQVTDVDEFGVTIGDKDRLYAQNVFWAAGVQASPLAKTLGAQLDHSGRVIVGPDLSVPGHSEVFVIGDMASMIDAKKNKPVPGVAQGAIQSGRFVGEMIERELRKGPFKRPAFRYWNKGSMATIGKAKAVAEIGKLRFHGFFAWVCWSFVHIMFLVGFRNRIFVVLSWTWNYLLSSRGARLITGKTAFSVKSFFDKSKTETYGDVQATNT